MHAISVWCGGLELGTTLAGSRPSLASARLLPSFLGHVKPGRPTLRIEKPAGMPPLWAFLSCPPSPQTHILRGQRGLSLSCPWTCHSPGPLPRQDSPQPRRRAALGSSVLCQFSRRPFFFPFFFAFPARLGASWGEGRGVLRLALYSPLPAWVLAPWLSLCEPGIPGWQLLRGASRAQMSAGQADVGRGHQGTQGFALLTWVLTPGLARSWL